MRVRQPLWKCIRAWQGRVVGLEIAAGLVLIGLVVGGSRALGEAIAIPNASYESPTTDFVNINVSSWQKAPKPSDYDETGTYQWNQLIGLFKNTASGKPDHLINCDGNQAVWVFAVPGVAMFQDHDTTDWRSDVPSHEFDAVFEPGKSYQLTVGVLGGGGNMLEGPGLELSLYFRDASSNRVTIASTTAVNSAATFPLPHTQFVDYVVQVPVVKTGDPWAGQHVGIQIRSVVTDELAGGYWDVDNVRLTAESPPILTLSVSQVGTDLRIAWPSVSGYQYQVKVTDDLQAWQDYGTPMPGTGAEVVQLVPIADGRGAFFSVLAIPSP